MRPRDRVADILHRPADVMSRTSLHPGWRAEIEQGALQVL
jgi:predicted nucleotidyltransferase